jgi:hypothetical protein
MKLSLLSLARFVSYLAVLAVIVAAGLARLVPPPVSARRPAVPALSGCSALVRPEATGTGLTVLETVSGRLLHHELEERDQLDLAAASPWRESDGQYQIVGRWRQLRRYHEDSFELVIGLARMRYPSLELLDVVPTRAPLAGTPCWRPDTVSQVVYPCADGRLGTVFFDDPASPPREFVLEWDTARPGVGRIELGDPAWPTDSRLRGRLLVTLQYQWHEQGRFRYAPTEIWWIELDESRTAIVAAGPVANSPASEQKRCPVLVPRAADGLALAYLCRNRHGPWRLEVVPLTRDHSTGMPQAVAGAERVLASGLTAPGLALAADGRALFALRPLGPLSAVPVRIDLDNPVP